jgi:D-alanine--poly(phosphoribitol) ligase subunit 1
MKNILEWIERSAAECPDKTVFADENGEISYQDFLNCIQTVGSAVAGYPLRKCPVLVLLPRGIRALTAMFGIVYSGNFYVILDSEMPVPRMKMIAERLCADTVITDGKLIGRAQELSLKRVILLDEALKQEKNQTLLHQIRNEMTDADPVYTLFTSGSTGTPKGVVITHRNVLSYIDWFVKEFEIGRDTVFGNQTPLYFSMSVTDVYGTLCSGATLHLIPRSFFTFPVKLIQFLNDRKINAIYWVPSALCLLANWKIFDYAKPLYLRKIMFAGEVMPVPQLNYWMLNIPDVSYANLFGPTETTDICTFYRVGKQFEEGQTLPIGHACDNCNVMVIKEDGTAAAAGEEGELYARGPFISPGYINDPEKTAEAFVQNPLQSAYPEKVYRTGDLVKVGDDGELCYLTRKDFQIKRMGYRIELGEIEAAASAVKGVYSCAAVYDRIGEKILLFYSGEKLEDAEIIHMLSVHIPQYMLPEQIIHIDSMPVNRNGKTDRTALLNIYQGGKQ